jgi:hypothetical protein
MRVDRKKDGHPPSVVRIKPRSRRDKCFEMRLDRIEDRHHPSLSPLKRSEDRFDRELVGCKLPVSASEGRVGGEELRAEASDPASVRVEGAEDALLLEADRLDRQSVTRLVDLSRTDRPATPSPLSQE